MNELGLIVLEVAARATALALVGLVAVAVLKRRGPSAGALAGSTTLAVLVGVAALAPFSWPRWWSPGEADATRPTVDSSPSTGRVGGASEGRPDLSPGATPTALPTFVKTRAGWSDFVREFGRELAGPTEAARSTGWRWPAWVACGFLAGLAVALARLGLGLWAVRSLRGRSRPVDDPRLLAMVAALRSEMGLDESVELRESGEVATPATVGWRKPAILLPKGWTAWDESERRAVLAHELAHVLRGDYAAGLAAQVSLSMHFYHPLVHALARRLRLQQELAADAWGAKLAGGRRAYLTALANLALRQDPRPAAWPARPFLPTRGTFLRRIEMLRDPKVLQQPPLPPRGRLVTVATLVLAGLIVAGLRGPGSTSRVIAQEPANPKASPSTAQAMPPLDPSSASSDVHLAIDIRPAALLKNPDFKKVIDRLPTDGPKEIAAILSGEIEQIVVLGFDRQPGGNPPNPIIPPQLVFVFRAAKPMDWRALITPKVGKVEEVKEGGIAYFRAGNGPSTCYRVLDDRTLLMGNESDAKLPPIGGDRPKGRHGWDDAWKTLAPGAIRMAFDTPWLVRQVKPGGPGRGSQIAGLVSPLFDKTQAYALTLDVADGLALDALATCGTEDGAARVADTIRASLTLARNSLPDLRLAAEKGPPDAARALVDLVDALDSMLETAKAEQDKSVARLHAKADSAAVATAARMLLPAVNASREAARRAQSVNNLKQIGLAMHNYHSANGCFPPAVLRGPDGKTPYSWRVAILPYVEANDLYSQYKFDEPWDGPNNSKLLARMPAIYRDPSLADPNPSLTTYFAPTGPETIFPGDQARRSLGGGAGRMPGSPNSAPSERKGGVGLDEITDGTSNTIMIVEARRDIPWTKPEDIPVDKDKPLPQLGGLHPSGFDVLFADGSVRFIKDTINPQVLHALLTRSGGEVVSADRY